MTTGKCLHFDCDLRTEEGYCKLTACINPKYNRTFVTTNPNIRTWTCPHCGTGFACDFEPLQCPICGRAPWQTTCLNTYRKTNYLDVVTKSIEELAKWMEYHDYCPDPLPDAPCIGPDGEPRAEYDCYQCCLDWLRQEAQK